MDSLLQDLRFGVRLLWRDKGFTLAAVLTLGVCLGANAALFTVVDTVLLRPLPFPHASRLVAVHNAFPHAGFARAGCSVPDYFDRLGGVPAFDQQAIYRTRRLSVSPGTGAGRSEQLETMIATPSLFRMLEAHPVAGRTFTDDDAQIGREHKAILSYATWRQMFGGDRGVIGREVRIADVPYTVVGVMPRGFWLLDPDVRLWTPAAFGPKDRSDDVRFNDNWEFVGRLKPGASIEQAQAQIDAVNAANYDRLPQFQQLLKSTGFHTFSVPLQADLVRNVRAILFLLWGGALFVLLIGAVNVANLALVRSRGRLRELATRVALGAGRLRLSRQLVTESLVVAVAGGGLGLLVGYGALKAFALLNLRELPRGESIHLDGAAIAFTLVLAVLVGLAVSVIPIVSIAHADLSGVFHEDARTGTSGRGAQVVRRVLVVTQVAVAFVLLFGAGLLLASFRRVAAIDPGFDPHGVLTASVRLPDTRYATGDAERSFASRALDRIRALPGVTAAGLTDVLPLSGDNDDSVIFAEGHQMRPGESVISPDHSMVTPGYFAAMRIPLVKGRLFNEHDTKDSLPVIIIDERLARHFWPDTDPIGQRMYFPTDMNNMTAITPKTKFLTVVGVVREVAMHGIAEGETPVGADYLPFAQSPVHPLTFAIRTSGDPDALIGPLRAQVAVIDPELPVYDVETMPQRAADALLDRRSPLVLSVGFGAVALFLAAIGIYGVLAYLVAQRRKEIGIRIALGSTGGQIFELILREGLVVVGIGFVVGLAGTLAVGRGLQSQLYQVRPADPFVLAGAAALLAAVAFAACLVPAGRATRVDPVVALRQE